MTKIKKRFLHLSASALAFSSLFGCAPIAGQRPALTDTNMDTQNSRSRMVGTASALSDSGNGNGSARNY